MKRLKIGISLLMAIIMMAIISTTSFAIQRDVTISSDKTDYTITSDETFEIKYTFTGKQINHATLYLEYDSSVLSFVTEEGEYMNPEGYSRAGNKKVAIYEKDGSQIFDSITFKVKAGKVTENTDTTITVLCEDETVIDDDDTMYPEDADGLEQCASRVAGPDYDGGFVGPLSVNITVKPSTITLGKTEIELEVGKTEKIDAQGEGLTFKSADEKIAKVSEDGTVTGVAAGSTTITITDKYGNTKTVKVTVKEKSASGSSSAKTPTKLPQAGEGMALIAIIGAVVVFAVIRGIKARKMSKLF